MSYSNTPLCFAMQRVTFITQRYSGYAYASELGYLEEEYHDEKHGPGILTPEKPTKRGVGSHALFKKNAMLVAFSNVCIKLCMFTSAGGIERFSSLRGNSPVNAQAKCCQHLH
jgi:hypothetical protein